MKYAIKRVTDVRYGLEVYVKTQNTDGWFNDTNVLSEAKQFDNIEAVLSAIQLRTQKNPSFGVDRFTIVGIRPMASVVTYEEVTL